MTAAGSRLGDVLIRIIRAAEGEGEPARLRRAAPGPGEPLAAYTALIYTDLKLPLSVPTRLPRGCSPALSGRPLAGAERLEVGWSRYEDYLAAFLQGEKAAEAMRSQLLRTLSPALAALFEDLSTRPVRLWLSSDAPELEELPWELLLGDPSVQGEGDFSFVRGSPPELSPPLVPVEGKPRLALIGAPPFAPGPLWAQMNALQNVEVVALSGEPRAALATAVAGGFELLHLVADGYITQAYEGALYFHGVRDTDPAARALPAAELVSHLLASQIAVLGLTVPDYDNPDVMPMAGRSVPSAYRAYAHLAADPSLPTLVAPMGPLDPPGDRHAARLAAFWGTFYESVGTSYNVEEGMRQARKAVRGAPVALFLHRPHGVLFRRAPRVAPEVATQVSQKAAEYALSVRFTNRLQTLQQGLESAAGDVSGFLQEESVHQQRIAGELAPWTQAEGGEG